MTYINVTPEQLVTLGKVLDDDHCLSETEREIVSAQIERDGEIELDDEVVASRGDDHGMYVMAWVWVDFPKCACGERTDALDQTMCEDCRSSHPRTEETL